MGALGASMWREIDLDMKAFMILRALKRRLKGLQHEGKSVGKEGFHCVRVARGGATRAFTCKGLHSKDKIFIIFGLIRGALRVPRYKSIEKSKFLLC